MSTLQRKSNIGSTSTDVTLMRQRDGDSNVGDLLLVPTTHQVLSLDLDFTSKGGKSKPEIGERRYVGVELITIEGHTKETTQINHVQLGTVWMKGTPKTPQYSTGTSIRKPDESQSYSNTS